MKTRRSVSTVATMLAALAAATALAADGFGDRLDQARRQTWSVDSREQGVAGLRELIAERPDAFEPRLELARVLTWSPSTRGEGVTGLRGLLRERPESPEVIEPLAEVLSWDEHSRGEAVRMLRDLNTKPVARPSGKLVLAEILSWSLDTREEAEKIYRDVLASEPGSVRATVGLARVRSWQGDFGASMRGYEAALRLDPADPQATAGLALVQGWTGRPLASLRTLDQAPAKEAASQEGLRARGDAYASLGMPSKAMEQYRSYLAIDPTDASAQKAVQELESRLRPTLHVGGEGSTESGDPVTSKVETTAVPVSFHFGIGGDLALAISAEGGSYRNDSGSTKTVSLGAGLEGAFGPHVRIASEIARTGFDQAADEWTGRIDLRIAPVDRVELRVGAERELLLDSRMSAAGETIDGILYGPASRDNVFAGATVRIGKAWDVSAIGAKGTIDGTEIASNDRRTLYGGVGRAFRIGSGWLRAGATWYRMEDDLDLGGFPQTDLAGDGVTTRGVGGYFSPFSFTNRMVRIDAAFPAGSRVRVTLGGAIGRQSVRDTLTEGSEDTSSEASLGLAWKVHERVTMRARIERQNVAAAFDRTRAGLEWVFAF
jgi:tetratricopeptide (TPR) repeat protein